MPRLRCGRMETDDFSLLLESMQVYLDQLHNDITAKFQVRLPSKQSLTFTDSSIDVDSQRIDRDKKVSF